MFANPTPVFRFLLPAFLIYAALITVYNRWYLKQIQKYNFWILIRPLLLVASGFGIFLVIPASGLRSLFLLPTALFITGLEIILGNLAENILLNETLIIAFGLFLSLFGAYYYLPATSFEIFYLFGIFLGSALLTRSFYELLPKSERSKQLGAIIIGLFCAELYWVLNFLHFHFSVLSILLFNIFYFCLIVNYYHLYHMLNYKKIKFHLFLILACSVVVLISTPWIIVK
jgi:hypothetical protein